MKNSSKFKLIGRCYYYDIICSPDDPGTDLLVTSSENKSLAAYRTYNDGNLPVKIRKCAIEP